MADIQLSEATDEIVLKIKDAMGLGKEVPKWVVLRLALARSLALEGAPIPEDYPIKGKTVDYHLQQVTGRDKIGNTPIESDYTDHFNALIAEHAGKRFATQQEINKILQAHIHRGLLEMSHSYKEGDNFFDYLYQELFYPLEMALQTKDQDIKERLANALEELQLGGEFEDISDTGPRFITYTIKLRSDARIKDFLKAKDDLKIKLGLRDLLIEQSEKPGYVLVRHPKANPQTVYLKDMLTNSFFLTNKGQLPAIIGVKIDGSPYVLDLVDTPHLLIAGTTGSGKSITLQGLLLSALSKSSNKIRLILIDPKRVEMQSFKEFTSLLCRPLTEINEIKSALQWAINEMEERYRTFENLGIRDISEANRKGHKIPYILIAIDELADLLMQDSTMEAIIARIAQMGRASGLHLILATQRPSADILTGLIRSNVPSRIALRVQKSTESKIILDEIGAEALLGKGDMLVKLSQDSSPVRVHGALVLDEDFDNVKRHLPKNLSHDEKLLRIIDAQS